MANVQPSKRPRDMRMRTVHGVALLALLAIGSLAACSVPATSPTAANGAPSPPRTASPAAEGTSLGVEEQAALAAYEQAWADAAAVEDGGNYRDSRLTRHIAGKLLLTVSEDDYIEETNGVASRGAPILHPRVSAQNLSGHPPTVTITDCIDFRHFIQYYKATGKQYGAVQTGLSTNTSTMTLTNGIWMMTSAAIGADGSCTL